MQEWTVEVAYVFNLTVHAETMSKAVYEAGKLEDRMRDAGMTLCGTHRESILLIQKDE